MLILIICGALEKDLERSLEPEDPLSSLTPKEAARSEMLRLSTLYGWRTGFVPFIVVEQRGPHKVSHPFVFNLEKELAN